MGLIGFIAGLISGILLGTGFTIGVALLLEITREDHP